MKSIALLLFLIVSINLCQAQEQLATEQKVVFGENEKLYVNKNLGIYLWMSTSPEKDSPKHRLLSDSSKKHSNPMYFDTEGYNTLRSPSAVNPKTKRIVYPIHDIVFEVYADSKAPITKYKLVSGNSVYRKNKLFYGNKNGRVAFTFSSTDRISGVEKTYYSVNGGKYSEITDTLKLNAEGETMLKYYSSDKVGNREEVKEKKFIVDNSAPKTNYEIDSSKGVNKTVIKLKSDDDIIGVKTIYYKINNGSRQVYTKPIPISRLGSKGEMSFYAVDYLNNTEEVTVIKPKDY